jgi:hypothetical protein
MHAKEGSARAKSASMTNTKLRALAPARPCARRVSCIVSGGTPALHAESASERSSSDKTHGALQYGICLKSLQHEAAAR